MSDTEDQLILEDIQALENALSQKPESHIIPAISLKSEIISDINQTPEVEINQIQLFQNSDSHPAYEEENAIENTDTALQLNQKLIERLTATRNEVAAILEECIRKRAIIDAKINQRLKIVPSTKTLSSNAGMPYFKDKDFFSAPPNEDMKLIQDRGELQIIHLRRVCRWTTKDKEILMKAIQHEIIAELKDLDESEEDAVEKMHLGKSHCLPPIVKKSIGPLGTREFDWMKIAVTDFQNKHSPEECRVMWNIFLHPDINKFKWKKKELEDLEKLVKKYNYQDWDAIAKDLGSYLIKNELFRKQFEFFIFCFVKLSTQLLKLELFKFEE